jgi:hypothetical protein
LKVDLSTRWLPARPLPARWTSRFSPKTLNIAPVRPQSRIRHNCIRELRRGDTSELASTRMRITGPTSASLHQPRDFTRHVLIQPGTPTPNHQLGEIPTDVLERGFLTRGA